MFDMKKWIPDIIYGLLVLLFVYTAASKLADRQHFVAVMSQMLLIKNFAPFIAVALPLTELIAAFFLLRPQTRLYGLYTSLGLMIVFTLYLGYMILFSKHLPCSCGGVLQKMNWIQHLLFNVFFTNLCFIGIKLYHSNKNIVATDRQPDQQAQGKS
jgi:hypothetical protein